MNWSCVPLALGFVVRPFQKASSETPRVKPPTKNAAAKVGVNAFYLAEAQIGELLQTAARMDMPVGELLKAVIAIHAELGPETSWRVVWETLRRGDD
jgi:hypothetical protein